MVIEKIGQWIGLAWRRFRRLPTWAQVLSWVGLILVLASISSVGGGDSKSSEKTVAAPIATTSTTSTTSVAPTTTSTTSVAPTTTKPVATTTLAPTTTQSVPVTTQAPAEPTLTASQQQAVRSAQSYLKSSSFSRQGLIGQLVYEKYTLA
ncbi:MAG: hypothetical protein F2754_08790, partial [Actinobacteria bacterium]|nr:hypothetical protein [Actinomycetota bacterium]